MAAKSRGISGIAIAMIGTGALLLRAAIKGTSPIDELRAILGGKKPEPLSTSPSGYTFQAAGGGLPGAAGPGGKARTVGAQSHVADEARFIASTWNVVADATLVSSGHITNSDHYKGLAIDVMLPAGAQGVIIGNAVAQHYQSNAVAKNVKYVIWQHTIWSRARGSHHYGKSDHMRHVHISFIPLAKPSYTFRPAGR